MSDPRASNGRMPCDLCFYPCDLCFYLVYFYNAVLSTNRKFHPHPAYLRSSVSGMWYYVCGVWCVVLCMWCVVCGIMYVVCGVWYVAKWFSYMYVYCLGWQVVEDGKSVVGLWPCLCYLCTVRVHMPPHARMDVCSLARPSTLICASMPKQHLTHIVTIDKCVLVSLLCIHVLHTSIVHTLLLLYLHVPITRPSLLSDLRPPACVHR